MTAPQAPRRALCPVCDLPAPDDEQAPSLRGLTVFHGPCWDRLVKAAGPQFLAMIIQRIEDSAQ